jgi:hypothetical protein
VHGPVVARRCGFLFTTTGRPCGNRVAEGAPWCRAGHPSAAAGLSDDIMRVALGRSGVVEGSTSGPTAPPRRPVARGRRATELLRRALSSDDAELHGTRAEHILSDDGAALMLLGSPDASDVACAAVIQRYGLVGAFLVVGYEERWRRSAVGGDDSGTGGPMDVGAACLETMLQQFPRLDARRVDRLLREIDRPGYPDSDSEVAIAHRWLHATYAVAARDGTARAHRAYLRALDRVLRLVGPLVLP